MDVVETMKLRQKLIKKLKNYRAAFKKNKKELLKKLARAQKYGGTYNYSYVLSFDKRNGRLSLGWLSSNSFDPTDYVLYRCNPRGNKYFKIGAGIEQIRYEIIAELDGLIKVYEDSLYCELVIKEKGSDREISKSFRYGPKMNSEIKSYLKKWINDKYKEINKTKLNELLKKFNVNYKFYYDKWVFEVQAFPLLYF